MQLAHMNYAGSLAASAQGDQAMQLAEMKHDWACSSGSHWQGSL